MIQKHAASHLHFDFWLKYHGTFRSWAVPKGPPLDRRLAMEAEDPERENARLKKLVADLALDKAILQEASKLNF